MNFTPTLNIAIRIKNTRLLTEKPLLSLFEVTNNSIHSFLEKESQKDIKFNGGKIIIDL